MFFNGCDFTSFSKQLCNTSVSGERIKSLGSNNLSNCCRHKYDLLNFHEFSHTIFGANFVIWTKYRRASTGLNRIWISSQCRHRRRHHRARLGDPVRVQLLLLGLLTPPLQQLAVRGADQQLLLRRQSRLQMPRCNGVTLGVIQ